MKTLMNTLTMTLCDRNTCIAKFLKNDDVIKGFWGFGAAFTRYKLIQSFQLSHAHGGM